MTPPEAPVNGSSSQGMRPPAVSVCPKTSGQMQVLAKRADFLKAARARKQGTSSMLVQARKRPEGEAEGIRIGFTCSKKVGNAVARNRAKRRLREAARAVLLDKGKPGWDYVLIGKKTDTIARPFPLLISDLEYALRKLHK
ncbi:ribonuclease P protein component [Falsiruegeria litorea]|uniref:ribonuclease P protein component n=1 Tax=Falsiruegeria litorea TaxID=1280831 RepID=UPI000A26E17A|nr:ribonuclease P protein component [Falsiruegeria litorea]